ATPVKFSRLAMTLIAGAALVLAIPVAAQVAVQSQINQAMPKIVGNQTSPDRAAIDSLRQLNNLCLHLCAPNINAAFQRQHTLSYEAGQNIADIYKAITGETFQSTSCSE